MDPVWDTRSIRTRCATPEIAELLDSFARSVELLKYHEFTARTAMENVISDRDYENGALTLGVSPRQAAYSHAKLVSEANIIGAMNMVRAVADIFAFLVNRIVPTRKVLEDRRCYFTEISSCLDDSPLRDAIEAVQRSAAFRYVQGFSNLSKHRRLVRHGFIVPFNGDPAHIRLSAFESKEQFQEMTADSALDAIGEVARGVLRCGIELSSSVSKNSP